MLKIWYAFLIKCFLSFNNDQPKAIKKFSKWFYNNAENYILQCYLSSKSTPRYHTFGLVMSLNPVGSILVYTSENMFTILKSFTQ